MPSATDTRDKVIALGVQVEHLTKTVEENAKLTAEMHAVLLQGKGAAKFLVVARGCATFVLAFIAAQFGAHFPFH